MDSHTNVKRNNTVGKFFMISFGEKKRCKKARPLVMSDRYVTRTTRLVPCEVLEQPSQVEHAIAFVRWSTATSQVD